MHRGRGAQGLEVRVYVRHERGELFGGGDRGSVAHRFSVSRVRVARCARPATRYTGDVRPVVLASTSPHRLALLRAAGIFCAGVAPTCDEASISHPDPVELAARRAAAKARSVHAPESIVVGADQVAHIDGHSFGKPLDPADHRARLRQLRGRAHLLTVGVHLRVTAEDGSVLEEHAFTETTALRFRADVSDAEIDAYVATGEGSGCAGGYAAEGLGAQLIERIDGDWTNVIGLPVYRLIGSLRAIRWRPSFPTPPSGPLS